MFWVVFVLLGLGLYETSAVRGEESNEVQSEFEKMLLEKLNLAKPPPAVHGKYVAKWYVQEGMDNINRKRTRFGEQVDTIRFSNALGYSKEDKTYKLVYSFDLTGVTRYKKIFGHDLYFRPPSFILKQHGTTAKFNVSVWEAQDRLLNTSMIEPVSGDDYKIVIDSLSGAAGAYKHRVEIEVDMGCSVEDFSGNAQQSNASIATYGYMPPKKLHFEHRAFLRARRRLTRHRREADGNTCCSMVPYKRSVSEVRVGEDEVAILPNFIVDNTCLMKQGFKGRYSGCRTVSEPENLTIAVSNSALNYIESKEYTHNLGRWCYCV